MDLKQEVKDLLLSELRAKGYAPNPQDVVTAADKVIKLVQDATLDEVVAAEPSPTPVPVLEARTEPPPPQAHVLNE